MSNDQHEEFDDAIPRGNDSISFDDDTVIWEGRPSQWVNLHHFALFGLIFIVSGFGLVLWDGSGVMVLSAISIIFDYMSVRCEYTVITMNKIKEAKGITDIFRQELFCEIHNIDDIVSPPPGVMALVGLSTVVLKTSESDQPIIEIRGIKDRDALIDKLYPVWRRLKIERKGYL
jgi:cytochrome c oxidase subunit IV